MQKIAIIGAGLSGLTLARQLADTCAVTLFEKSRDVSGRMSTRRLEPYAFDHGAQYFTARSEAFQTFLKPHIQSGLIQEWPGHIVTFDIDGGVQEHQKTEATYVSVPGMNAFGKTLAEGVDVRCGVQISTLKNDAGEWHLSDAKGALHGPFDWVISAIPAPQAIAILPVSVSFYEALKSTGMMGCFTLMLGFDHKLPFDWDAAFVKGSPIGWMAMNMSKPKRPRASSLVVQSTNVWAEDNLEEDQDRVAALLLCEIKEKCGIDGGRASYQSLHRWRYASVTQAAGAPFLLDEDARLAACGDWCLKGRVEAAFESGFTLGEALKPRIMQRSQG